MDPLGVDLSLMTLRQAADATGLSATTLRRYIKSGRLRARLIPGRYGPEYVVDVAALEAAGLGESLRRESEGQSTANVEATVSKSDHEASSSDEAGQAMLQKREGEDAPTRASSVRGESVPGTLYRELLMKHEQLLVQFGALRASGQQLYEVRKQAEQRAREAHAAAQDLERVRNRHAREIGELKAKQRQAALELAEKEDEIRRLKARVRTIEMTKRNEATANRIDEDFVRSFGDSPFVRPQGGSPNPDH